MPTSAPLRPCLPPGPTSSLLGVSLSQKGLKLGCHCTLTHAMMDKGRHQKSKNEPVRKIDSSKGVEGQYCKSVISVMYNVYRKLPAI